MITSGRFRQAFVELMKEVGTNIPGHIVGFDESSQLAQVQIGIKVQDTNGDYHDPGTIIECPVHFQGGSEWFITNEIQSGAEGVIMFSQRCITGWLQTGGIANNPIARFHDMDDAIFIPGVRSAKTAISSFDNDGIEIRNSDNDVFVKLKNDKSISVGNGAGWIYLLPTGEVNINGVIISTDGSVTAPATVTAPTVSATTSLTVAGQEMSNHGHDAGSYNVDGESVSGVSGAPTTGEL